MSRVFAYCRVSTIDQTSENQVREIANAGFAVADRRTVQETISGSTMASARPGFVKLLERMESGDVLVVTKLDRLGRNAMDVRATVEKLAALGVRVHCLALGGVDLTSPAGKMTMQVIAAVAEFERDLLIERTRAGMARAIADGKNVGRPRALRAEQRDEAARRVHAGENLSEIARSMNTSRANIQRVKRALAVTA